MSQHVIGFLGFSISLFVLKADLANQCFLLLLTLQKIFLTSKFSYLLFFCNGIYRAETTGTANRWEPLLIANHLDQSRTGSNR